MKKYYSKRRYVFFLLMYFLFAWFCFWAIFRLTENTSGPGPYPVEDDTFLSWNLIKGLILALIIMIFPIYRYIKRRKRLK